ncbi:MAG: hypothetical protein MUF15_10555, partial [Acidobacteria bacterium]|nr:hypothetical protein [Acidobacteriota bacterium]
MRRILIENARRKQR